MPTTLVALAPPPTGAHGFALRLRLGEPPLVVRVADDRVLLDPRTVLPEQDDTLVERVAAVMTHLLNRKSH